MIRICAWCRQEGKTGIIGTSTGNPGETKEAESHGICHDHGIRLRQAFKRKHAHPPLPTARLSPSSASY
ncbi:MAG TPA: hypothetical protein PKK23_11595 [Nitrospirales bacterium]|nr:hypothetical protein [Nitrospirales bacterium]